MSVSGYGHVRVIHLNEAVVDSIVKADHPAAGVNHFEALPRPARGKGVPIHLYAAPNVVGCHLPKAVRDYIVKRDVPITHVDDPELPPSSVHGKLVPIQGTTRVQQQPSVSVHAHETFEIGDVQRDDVS